MRRTALVAAVLVGSAAGAVFVAGQRSTPRGPAATVASAGGTGRVADRRARFVRGEADERGLTPAQVEYANRAFPLVSIDDRATRAAARAAALLGSTGRGRGASRVPAWRSLGPRGVSGPLTTLDPSNGGTVSGRVTALAVVPGCRRARCTIYLGAAGGGVWKTTDGLAAHPHWQALWDAMPTTAVGSIALDPRRPSTVYVGTGEANTSNDAEAGLGIFRSLDAGRTWHRLASAPFRDLAVAALAVSPADPRVLYAGTALARHGASGVWGGRTFPPGTRPPGLFRSRDGGHTWRRVLTRTHRRGFYGGVVRIVPDPSRASRVYAGVFGYGVYASANGGSSWRRILAVAHPDADAAERVDLDVPPTAPNTMYVFMGTDGGHLYRTTDARRPRPRFTRVTATTPTSAASDGHGTCGDQCDYDLVVRVDPRRPRVVYLGGAAVYDEIYGSDAATPLESNGRILVRSDDGGRTWTDMTLDRQGDGLHPDMHAIAFAADSRIWFAANDGGIWRSDGRLVDQRAACQDRQLAGDALTRCRRRLALVPHDLVSLNGGLDTLQFQGLGLDRTHGLDRIIGGTQDNGTELLAGGAWRNTINGDGGQAAIGTDGIVAWHTYFDPQIDVSVNRGGTDSWVWTGDPLVASREQASFYVPLQADVAAAGTAYVGLEHVWRTTDAGGMRGADAATMDARCNELHGIPDPAYTCGDWEPLGDTLTRGDGTKAGEFVSWVAQSPDQPDVVWAATRAGRVFRTANVRAPDPRAVVWSRIDTAIMPRRFVSGLAQVPGHPDRVDVAFSGYGANTPDTPGHVFALTTSTTDGYGAATDGAKDISYDLPDAPITALTVDRRSGDLYAGSDFGVWSLPRGSHHWRLFGAGLPHVAVFSLEYHAPTHTLVAGTHGRGVWTVRLP